MERVGKGGSPFVGATEKRGGGRLRGEKGDGTTFMGAHFSGWKWCWDAGKTEKRCRHQLSQKKSQSVTAFDLEIESTCPLQDLDFPSVCGNTMCTYTKIHTFFFLRRGSKKQCLSDPSKGFYVPSTVGKQLGHVLAFQQCDRRSR